MLERILSVSLSHRYLVVMLTLGIVVAGALSLPRLTIDAVPDITNNQVPINTGAPALSPVEVEKQVTFPIETALAGVPGLQYTRSLSRNGFSQVIAVFSDSVDIYFARQQVAERLSEAKEDMPPGVEPLMGAISTGLGEVYMWTVEFAHPQGQDAETTDGKPGWQSNGAYLTPEGEQLTTDVERATYLRTVQDWIIRPQLRGVEGVAEIEALGGYEKEYHVEPSPMKLCAYGLRFQDLIEALARNNVSTGAGYIEHNGESYVVRATGRIQSTQEIANIVVGERRSTPIRISDVASVAIGGGLRAGTASENGSETVIGTALMLIGANSRTVAKAVDERMIKVRKTLPPDVRVKTVLTRTKLVDSTIHTVLTNLTVGACLVVVVLFVLLGNFRAALITALAIPLSVLMMSMSMVQGRVSGNLMSLGAIDFGLIVDGAVIIVENCLRRLAERQGGLGRKLNLSERLHEVKAAATEMIRPSVFGQAIIITVYLPILTLTGVEGKMFKPMAITVVFALASAFVLSLTFVPAMVALLIRGEVKETENFLIRVAKRVYAPILRWALRLRYPLVAAAVVAFTLALLLFTHLGQEFIPTLDEGDFDIIALRIPSTGLTQSTLMQLQVEKTIGAFPEVAFVFSKTGTADMATDPLPPNATDTFVIMKPKAHWPDPSESKEHFRQRLEVELIKLPGNKNEFTQPIEDRFNEMISGVRSDIAVKVYGDEFAQMLATAAAVAHMLQGIPGAADVKADQTEGLPTMTINIDRDAIARYGLNVSDVQEVIGIAVGGRNAGLVFEGDKRFNIVVRLPEALRQDLSALQNLPIPLPARGPDAGASYVTLSAVAKVELAEGLNEVSRENGKRRIVVQANVRGRDMGSFVAEAQRRMDQEVKLPAGVWLDWGGQFENMVAARERLLIVVPLCFFLIFLLLFSTFNSVKYALLVFTGVPLALTGGIVALWLRGFPFSITAAVGFIALSGVAVLNGLVMVTFINQLRRQGTPLEEAIHRGSLTRLRPVLTTALVASLGFIPMAFATGTGAEVQKPLATVVIGGLISSTLLTLIVLPALYRVFEFSGREVEAIE